MSLLYRDVNQNPSQGQPTGVAQPGARLAGQPQPAQQPSPAPQGESNASLANLQQMGQMELPEPKSNIHVLNIVGQVEGHMVLPPQNKTSKYEHLIPSWLLWNKTPALRGS